MITEREEHLKAIAEALEPIMAKAEWEAICEVYPEIIFPPANSRVGFARRHHEERTV